jgi:hypothetical protein
MAGVDTVASAVFSPRTFRQPLNRAASAISRAGARDDASIRPGSLERSRQRMDHGTLCRVERLALEFGSQRMAGRNDGVASRA